MVRSLIVPGVAQHKNPVPNAAIHRGILTTSAILGKEPDVDGYPLDVETQARLCFHYLKKILTAAEASLQDVVNLDLYLADRADRPIVNQHWLECWPDPHCRPSRNAQVSRLPDGCKLQLVALAVLAQP
jgi:2-iminobutanoate/2-iminopropanoate deaminase